MTGKTRKMDRKLKTVHPHQDIQTNLSVATSFGAFIKSEKRNFQLSSHNTHFEMERKNNKIIFPY